MFCFRDPQQRSRVCRLLLDRVDRSHFWTPSGPSDEAQELIRGTGDVNRSPARVMLSLAAALWTDDEHLAFADLLTLEGLDVRDVGFLLIALANSPEKVDAWIAQQESDARASESAAPPKLRGFRDVSQRSMVCRTFLDRAGLGHIWEEDGPSEQAEKLREQDGGPLTSVERIVLLLAFAIWEGDRALTFVELQTVDQGKLQAVGMLLTTMGMVTLAIDSWLSSQMKVRMMGGFDPRSQSV